MPAIATKGHVVTGNCEPSNMGAHMRQGFSVYSDCPGTRSVDQAGLEQVNPEGKETFSRWTYCEKPVIPPLGR